MIDSRCEVGTWVHGDGNHGMGYRSKCKRRRGASELKAGGARTQELSRANSVRSSTSTRHRVTANLIILSLTQSA